MGTDTLAIKASHIWKKFRLYHQKTRTLKEAILLRRSSYDEFWALKDINLEVPRGETLGIVGSNGSGKSTFLKLIARILRPNKGTMEINGKVSAMLELGTGFHPELTGRENVFLNGSMLGLSRKEIKKRFDEIVGFSELEEFIDTPVKNYSSGMYARLAFAVAINVDPDILLIDEVLAVGDESFQARCFDKINHFKRVKKTIIFVSHNLDAVKNLCNVALWFDGGAVKSRGPAHEVVSDYLREVHAKEEPASGVEQAKEESRWGSREVEIKAVDLLNGQGEKKPVFKTGEPMTIRIQYLVHQRISEAVFGVAIYREDGLHITGNNTKGHNLILDCSPGEGLIEYQIPSLPLLKGKYLLTVAVHDPNIVNLYDWHERKYAFKVIPTDLPETHGLVYAPGKWSVKSTLKI